MINEDLEKLSIGSEFKSVASISSTTSESVAIGFSNYKKKDEGAIIIAIFNHATKKSLVVDIEDISNWKREKERVVIPSNFRVIGFANYQDDDSIKSIKATQIADDLKISNISDYPKHFKGVLVIGIEIISAV